MEFKFFDEYGEEISDSIERNAKDKEEAIELLQQNLSGTIPEYGQYEKCRDLFDDLKLASQTNFWYSTIDFGKVSVSFVDKLHYDPNK